MNASDTILDDLFASERWPVSRERAAVELRQLPAHTVLEHLSAQRLARLSRDADLSITLNAAITRLQDLSPDARLGDPGTEAARKAIRALVLELESSSYRDDPEVKSLTRAYRHLSVEPGPDPDGPDAAGTGMPPLLAADIRRACGRFIRELAERYLAELATFSLILFRDSDAGGAISKSLRTRRSAWMRALEPPNLARDDHHLALIPPPEAESAVVALAESLGVAEALPCVVFLGRVEPGSEAPSWPGKMLFRLSAYSLTSQRGDYPGRLAAIYKTVYRPGAIAAGTAGAALFDKVYAGLKLWNAIKLLAGLRFGAGGARTIEAARDLIDPSS